MLEKVFNQAEKYKKDKGYSVNINKESFSKEEKREAKEHDMSPTKYKIVKEIIDSNDEFSMDDFDDLKEKSMKELKDFPRGNNKGEQGQKVEPGDGHNYDLKPHYEDDEGKEDPKK